MYLGVAAALDPPWGAPPGTGIAAETEDTEDDAFGRDLPRLLPPPPAASEEREDEEEEV